jgi:hypothetical protein
VPAHQTHLLLLLLRLLPLLLLVVQPASGYTRPG